MKARISLSLAVSGFLLILCHASLIAKAQLSSVSLENSPISYLDAIIGGTILLPCDLTPPTSDDSSILVLFYRGENKTPIYSVDSRESSLSNGIHMSAVDFLGQRAYMNTHPEGSGLVIKDVQLNDRGLYRCRVDFKTSPTRNSRIQLRVIEPPRRISIVSNWDGERRAGEVIGPYPEDSDVTLSCQVIGGIPSPRVTWWQEGSLLDDVSEVTSEGVTRNTLHLPKLTRADLLKVITCQAVNSNLTSPLTKAVTIDLAYPPSAIRVTSTLDKELNPDNISHNIPMTVTCISGQKCPLQCRVDGSRPPPLVTWKSNGRTLESEFETISSPPGAKERGSLRDSASFYSTLMLTANPEDNGAMISCRASSPALPSKAIEDNVKLNVLYKPELKLTVNEGLDLLNVEEGEDLHFQCEVKANPEVTEIHWTRNWVPLVENSSSGIHLSKSGSSLHLKRVNRMSSGHYACAAANSRGAGTSNAVLLSIKFSPKCSTKQVTSVGIGKSESANVTCRVEAHPTATIFRWAFNSSEELIDIPFDQQIEKNDSSNTITYQPRSPFDFGDLLCWASNSVGTMKEPCIIKILPIDKPEGVRGCKVSSNGTMPDGTITVTCLPGWDGGLAQSFTLEVRKAAHVHARILAALQHSSNPVFHLRNLLPGQEYLLTITSANPRGTSPSVTLSYTPPEEVIAGLTKKHSDPESTFMKFLPFVAIFVALIVVLTTCVSIIACIARSKAAEKALNRKEDERRVSMENRKGSAQHSLPPDRGKDELEDEEDVEKDQSEHYCAVHGHERRENEYISYKHYFNNMRDDTETQHLLKSSVGGSSGMDNQLNACNSSGNSRDSSSSSGIDRNSPKEMISEFSCGRSGGQQRFSEGSFRGLAPLASVDSLSGFSTISNHSSNSKKAESSSQNSYRAMPEIVENNDCATVENGFLPRSQHSTLPSVKVTPFNPVFQHSSLIDTVPYPSNPISFPSKREHFEQTVPHTSVMQHTNYSPIYSTYSPPCGDIYCQQPPFPHRLSSTNSLNSKSYEVNSIPSLPPPSISTHPMFINDSLKASKLSKEDRHIAPLEYVTPERKLSRESSV